MVLHFIKPPRRPRRYFGLTGDEILYICVFWVVIAIAAKLLSL